MRVVEGNVVSVDEIFLDDFNEPLYPLADGMGPIVTLVDPSDGYVLAEVVATTSETPGGWTADLAIPDLGLVDDKKLIINWRYDSEEGPVRSKSELIVEPAQENRATDIICLVGEDTMFDVTLPFHLNVQKDTLKFQISVNNEILVDNVNHKTAGIQMTANRAKTCAFRIPLWAASYRLEPMSFIAKHYNDKRKRERLYTFKLWAVTPQILIAASLVEDHIDKARAKNVIPELEYTTADILTYLFRGLALFNQIGPRVTGFWGTNMQGTILDGWVTCACYYALSAQLQAEGQMAFDFTGQVVNLNMDRTPSIEAALGRIETQIQGPVTNLKRLLSKAGVNDGDGSQGGSAIDGARSLGKLGVTNSPTTKWATVGNRSIWVNTRYRIN
ncbi:head-tail connector protein [Dickeya phage vB_DsoM_JA29]|uniref:Putative head-to-tail joining protein n=1 Tax=Dickeya phage vB_DsoM_JA29 TaxID=2283031 RepID=A0A384ZXC1_9CAUD|nr:head-tail connector protein [Dickeya phage vB_DsoM_JA29]AXG66898.1 putative head-to-tail joining protein [Dickeya phage vB_DsoM_JA29]